MVTISPNNSVDISSSEYRNQLEQYLRYEIDIEKEANRKRILSNEVAQLQRLELGYVPFTQPLYFKQVILTVQVASDDPDSVNIRDDYNLFDESDVLVQFGHYEEKSPQEDDFPVVDESVDGKLYDIDKNKIKIVFPQLAESQEEHDRITEVCKNSDFAHIGELVNRTTIDREINAVRSLSDEKMELLCGHQEAKVDPNAKAMRESQPLDKDLYENTRQSKAISLALTTSDISCIQGPLGTGKTRVIIELIRRLINAGEKVLVTAETHQAVSNILVGKSELGDPDQDSLHYHSRINGFKINRVNPKPEKMTPFERNHYISERNSGDVYVSTNNSADSIADSRSNFFDVVIIDEATQARQSSTYIPLSLAEKAILVGDHKQLGPHRPYSPDVDQEPPELDFDAEESAFTRLYHDEIGIFGSDLGVMFNQQYRMHADIAGFPSQEFYNSELITADNIPRLNNMHPIIGYDVRNRTPDEVEENQTEAEAIANYLSRLISTTEISPGEIGVAAAYRDQVEVIKTAIEQGSFDSNSILIQTFDSFQGSEREVMVLSFTRSNSEGNIGYLSGSAGHRRLNVAMTRAKYHCAFFADWDTLCQGGDLYLRLKEYIRENGNFISN